MSTKQYIRVAWTEGGRVFTETGEEVKRLLRESYLHEVAANYFIRMNRPGYAYAEFQQAAEVCTNCQALWLQGDECGETVLPLLLRFLSMHRRCVEIAGSTPWLQRHYEGSRLQRDYRFLTGGANHPWERA